MALLALWLGRPLLDAPAARGLHWLAAAFGVMALLAFGLAHILLPMFALAPVPEERRQLASGAAAIAAIAAIAAVALAIAAAFGLDPLALRLAALACAAMHAARADRSGRARRPRRGPVLRGLLRRADAAPVAGPQRQQPAVVLNCDKAGRARLG